MVRLSTIFAEWIVISLFGAFGFAMLPAEIACALIRADEASALADGGFGVRDREIS
jgi:hypothetical protein